MHDQKKPREQLVSELMELQQRLADVEASDIGRKKKIEQLEREIAGHNQAQEKSRQSNVAVETALTGIITADMKGNITYANSAAARMWGYDSPSEMIGLNAVDRHPVRARSKAEQILRILRQEGIYFEPHGLPCIRKDGSEFVAGVRSSLIRDNSGKAVGVVGSFIDITDRMRAETELKIRNDINELFLTTPDDRVFAEVLTYIREAFASEFGTFGYFEEHGSFVTPAITRAAYWEKCKTPEKQTVFAKGVFKGLWARATEEKKTLYCNSGPFKPPGGHVPVENTIVAPLVYRNKVISAIRLANKAGGYNSDDRALLDSVVRNIAPVLHARIERNRGEKQRRQILAEKERLVNDLEERVKELHCLYGLSEYSTLTDISIEEMLNKAVSVLPQAWQYPEATGARIAFGGKVFETKNFAKAKWLQSADIRIDGEIVGVVEVCYLKEKPALGEGPFLNEERKLINTVSEGLGKAIQHDELERHQRLSAQILELLNRSPEAGSPIHDILLALKQLSGFEAVGIRLREGEDFPYYEASGFSADFVAAERCLCSQDDRGDLIRDSEGNAILECMCGNVIRGRTDPSQPFFTEGGSFWTNSTTRLLATTTDKDRGAHTRNRCNAQGYESVALIPLRSGKENIGLLQLNDSRPNMFRLEMIRNYEQIGASIGIALQRKKAAGELDRAHRQLKVRASELEMANSELSQYGYVVSHDLRAPLRAIQNYAEFLHEDLAQSLTGEQKGYLDGMLTACGEANILVEDLLSFSQIDRPEGHDESIEVGEVIKDILKSLGLSSEIEIVLEKNWPVIKTSRVLLQQIFQNLIVNAAKFNVSRPKRVELGFRPAEGNACEFFVRDNGIGIDRRYHEKIFRVFERLHTSREYEGTGIGLAIVEKSAAKLQGSIRVESDPGKGSTFFVTIPCGEEEEIDE